MVLRADFESDCCCRTISDHRFFIGSTLIDAHPFFRKPVANLLAHLPILSTYVDLPKTYFTSPKSVLLLQPAEAKTCVVLDHFSHS